MEINDKHFKTSQFEVEIFSPKGILIDILLVDFEGEILIIDEGIGYYECHGMYGRDVRPEPELQKITWSRGKYTDFENSRIERFLDDNYDEIEEAIMDEFSCTVY